LSYSDTIFFISSEFKGNETIRAAKEAGCHVLFMTEERLRDKPWAYDAIDEAFYTPALKKYQDVINTVTWLLRSRKVDRIVPLDEFEQELGATLREHLQLPGKSISDTKPMRDKLAMRNVARAAGIAVPEFIGVLNYDDLRAFMDRVPPMWLLKPRTEASAMGIRKAPDSETVWRALDELGDGQSYYLMEQFVPGEVFHVDSVVWDGKVVFTSVQQYGEPPLQTYQGGGIFTSRTLPDNSKDAKALKKINKQVIKAVGHKNGVTHAEFIKAHDDGKLYFLEIAARVGGAFIGDLIEKATGVNLWEEWARVEVALMRGEDYTVTPDPEPKQAGLLVTLARQEHPDLSGYNDPEVIWTADKPHHAALIVRSESAARVEALLASYANRFGSDFLAVHDPMGPQRTGLLEDE
jgi:biotin carboxylase